MTSDPQRSVPRIVLVEDDGSIGRSVVVALESDGYLVAWCRDGSTARQVIAEGPADLVLLDAGLPDTDGFSLCRSLRQAHPGMPIVMVTARDAEIDIVVGLDAGATDYVTKPFSMSVLLARVRAHLRGVRPDPDAALEVGAVRLEPAAYRASVHGTPVELRRREFELLVYLARHADRVVTRDRLLSDVWDVHWDTSTKTVDMHVIALRRKLGDAVEISSIRGVGYRLTATSPA